MICIDLGGEIVSSSQMGWMIQDTFKGLRRQEETHSYSQLHAEDPGTLLFWAAAFLRQDEFLLEFGVLLIQRLQLSRKPFETQRHGVRLEKARA